VVTGFIFPHNLLLLLHLSQHLTNPRNSSASSSCALSTDIGGHYLHPFLSLDIFIISMIDFSPSQFAR
jgi:hypothetical protein